MGAVSTLPAFLDNLRALLVARSGLSGVKVFTGGIADPNDLGKEYVLLASDAQSSAYGYVTVQGQQAFEEYTINGHIVAPVEGTGETGIKASRDRAFALLEQVHDQLATSSATTSGSLSALGVDDARLVGWSFEQTLDETKRYCELGFSIDVHARFTPS